MSMLQGFTQFINIKIAGSSTLGGAVDDAVSAMDRLEKRSKTMVKMGAGMAAAGAIIIGTFAPMTVQAGKFSTEISRAGALAGATSEQVTKMADTAKYLGATTLFTATQVASGQEALIRLGMTADQVGRKTGIMAQTLSFATAHQIEMADAGEMLVTTLKSFNAPVSQATKLADMFTTIVSRTAFDISSLKESMKAANAGIPAMNQSMATQITLLGLLADRGQKGSIGGTRLARAMSQVFTQAEKVRKTLNIEVYDKATGKQRDFINVMFDMQDAMKNLSEEQKLIKLTKITGMIGAKALIPLLNISRDEVMKLRMEIEKGAVSAAEFESIVKRTPVGKWELMKSAVSGVTMHIGEILLPIGMKLMEVVTGIADRFRLFMEAHPILTKLGLLTMAVGSALLVVAGGLAMAAGMTGLAVTGLINTAAALTGAAAGSLTFAGALSAVAGALLGVIAPFLPIAGAVALLYFAFKSNFLGIRDTVEAFGVAMKALWSWIKPVFLGIKDIVTGMVGKVITTVRGWFTDWNAQFEGGRAPLLRLAGTIAYAIGFIVGIFKKLFEFFSEHKVLGGALLTVFAGGALGVMKYMKASGSLINTLKGLPHALRLSADNLKFLAARMRDFNPATIGPKLKSAFTTGATAVRTGVSNIITSLGRGLKSAWAFSTGMVKSTIRWSGEVFRASLRIGKGLANLGLQFLKTAGTVALYGAKMIWAGVQATGQLIKGLALTSVGLFRQGAAFIASKAAMLVGAVATNIMTASQWALNTAMSANPIGLIVMGIVALIGVIILLVKNWDKVWSAVKTGIDMTWGVLKWFASAVAGVFTALIDPLKSPFKILKSFITVTFTPMIGFFSSIFAKVAGVFGGIGDSIKNFFSGILDSIKGAVLGFVNVFIDKIDWLIGVANKIPGVNIPLIPKLEIFESPEMKPARMGVELYEFTKSNNLVSKSPWTVKTADTSLKLGIEETKKPKFPLLKAIIEPIFQAIPVITVFARAILLEPLDTLFGPSPEVAMAGGFTLPSPAGGFGIVPSPTGGESYITHAPTTHTATSNNRTVLDRRVGPVNIIIQGGDPRNIRRELERFFEDLAAQGEGIDGLEIA